MASHPPEDCGRRLIPVLIDEIARSDPGRPFLAVPLTSDPRAGFEDVSYGSFAKAVNRCAWWLEERIGRSSNFETISYISHGRDLAYFILTVAAVKVGYKALFASPRNSLEAHLSLIDQSSCRIFLVQASPPSIVQDILASREIRSVPIPSYHQFLDCGYDGPGDGKHVDNEVPLYPFTRNFDDARCEPFVVFQTSGSTGMPKPVVMAHGTFSALDAHQLIPGLGGKSTSIDFLGGTRWFNGFPHYHTGCYLYTFGYGIYNNITTVLAPSKPLTPSLVNSLQNYGHCSGLVLPPSLLEDLTRDPDFLLDLGILRYVAYSGGPLGRDGGDKVTSVTKLFNWFGSTEAGLYPTVIHDEHWEYVEFSPFLGYELRQMEDHVFELVLVRKEEHDIIQGVFCTYPELREFATKELYSPHPSLPGLYKNQGRIDDIIAFSNAEKFNPVDTESSVCAHPAVSAAVVAGQGRFQASLLIEPTLCPGTEEARSSLMSEIWPTVERTNYSCVAQGRIEKDLVMLTLPEKPMLRTEKGTVRKKATIEAYRREIDEMYILFDHPMGKYSQLDSKLSSTDHQTSKDFLMRIFSTRVKKSNLGMDEDLWTLGFDSLDVLALTKEINVYMQQRQGYSNATITSQTIYDSVTLAELEAKLKALGSDCADGVDPADQAH